MKKLSKLLSLPLALSLLVPGCVSASSDGQDEMEKTSETLPVVKFYYEEFYLLNYTGEFFDTTYKSLYKEAMEELENKNTGALISYAKIMRTAYEEASSHKDRENQIWYKDKINVICQELESIHFKYVIDFLVAFAFNPRYSTPITKNEKNHFQVCFKSSCGELMIEFSSFDNFYEVEFKS